MKVLKILGLGLGVMAVFFVSFGIWVVWFGPPPVDVLTSGPAVRIDTRFLGEYYVAASLIEIKGSDGAPVLRATSSTSDCTSDLFVFVAGTNEVPELAAGHCQIEVPHTSETFELRGGDSYNFTVSGINGFGRHRTAS